MGAWTESGSDGPQSERHERRLAIVDSRIYDRQYELLISLGDAEQDALDLATELEVAGLALRIPAIVIWELYYGVGFGSKKIENQRDYEALFANKSVVDLDERIARRAGILMGSHRADDRKTNLDPGDSIVAATGLTLNEPVVTNDGDFQDVDGLAVERY